ncbi:DUF3293 domain-containing protein [Salinisphaera sp. USBA-960]|nr:DUF3293 domain-containing protein [Salifodinibacter halophilus]NNC26363.1 DUF3293 domain-containing protein [Salifodinibacter halophilus]
MAEALLEAAFKATSYRVALGAREISVTIGGGCPSILATWFCQHGYRLGWLISAYNPGAQAISTAQNRHRDAALHRATRRLGTAWLATRAVDPAQHWPDEPGVLIGGISQTKARLLATRFGQAAIVAIGPSRRTRLIWLSSH